MATNDGYDLPAVAAALNAASAKTPELSALPLIAGPTGIGISTALTALPEIYKLYQGIKQRKMADELAAKTVRPVYRTPGQINEATDLARSGYLTQGIPGQSTAIGNINATGQAGLRNAINAGGSTAEILAAGGAINQNQNNALNQIFSEGAGLHEQRRAQLMEALNNQARYKNQEFDYNEAQPYAEAMRTIGALRQGAGENTYGAMRGLASSGELGLQGFTNSSVYKHLLDTHKQINSVNTTPTPTFNSGTPTIPTETSPVMTGNNLGSNIDLTDPGTLKAIQGLINAGLIK